MIRALHAQAVADAPAATSPALHRRRAPVVVRAPGHPTSIDVTAADRRRRRPTLPGVGYRQEEDTLPILAFEELNDATPPPVSVVRPRETAPLPVAPRIPKAAPVPSFRANGSAERGRPVTLLDEVHDHLSRDYLEAAERILASGAFGSE